MSAYQSPTANMRIFSILIFLIVLLACQTQKDPEMEVKIPDRPNIVWLVTEDMSPYIPSFGDSTIFTPNLSRLAAEGIRYPNFFSPSGVCAPSRAAIITGMYPSSIGANNMRTGSHTQVTGLPRYEAVPPPEVKMFTEFLRRDGYYCTNNFKTDYQFRAPVTGWDAKGPYAHWRDREAGQPFFSVFNFNQTHESALFEPYGFFIREQRHYNSGDSIDNLKMNFAQLSEEETPVHVSKSKKFTVPPYLPDNEVVQRDLWKMYNNIAEMDRQVGAILDQLEQDGLLENTIIFFYGDHGGPLPRQKRLIYDAGLRAPLIVRLPNQKRGGTEDDQLVSFVDLAPTLLKLTGQSPPEYLQGRAFINSDTPEREYIHAAADRLDAYTDRIRAVRNHRFKYIRNYMSDRGYYLPIGYREEIPTMKELLRLRDENKLNDIQMQWFRENKPAEELFDVVNDPHEINNIINDPEYADVLKKLRTEMDRWLNEIHDDPGLTEAELIQKLWQGEETQPATENPVVKSINEEVVIECATPGASIGYREIREGKAANSWTIYTSPIKLEDGAQIEIQAHRIGFVPSESIFFQVE